MFRVSELIQAKYFTMTQGLFQRLLSKVGSLLQQVKFQTIIQDCVHNLQSNLVLHTLQLILQSDIV